MDGAANELEHAEWDARAGAERSIETPVKHYVPASGGAGMIFLSRQRMLLRRITLRLIDKMRKSE